MTLWKVFLSAGKFSESSGQSLMRQMMKISDACTLDQMFLKFQLTPKGRSQDLQDAHYGNRCICNDGYINGRPGSTHNIFSST